MNVQELFKYDFAIGFLEGKLGEHKFLAALIDKIRNDEVFRTKTQIFSIEVEVLNRVVNSLKEERVRISRRGFLKIGGMAAAGVAAFGAKSFAQENIDVRKLYEGISKIPQLNPASISFMPQTPDSPIIIIIEDIHGGRAADEGWTKEYVKLELLRRNFGLNFVGIEGWAGYDVDKKRGIRVLNGEDILIEVLIKNKNYNVIGLEDENAQRYMSIAQLSELYDKLSDIAESIRKIFKELNVPKEDIEKMFRYVHNAHEKINPQASLENRALILYKIDQKCLAYIYSSTGLPTHEQALKEAQKSNDAIKKWNADFDTIRKQGMTDENRAGFAKKYDELRIKNQIALNKLATIDSINSKFISYLETIDSIYSELYFGFFVIKFNDDNLKACEPKARKFLPLLMNSKPKNRSLYDYYVLDLRAHLAVKKMLSEMQDHNQKIGIVVFGKGHTQGLIEEFVEQTVNKVNIIVLENPDR